MSYFLAGEESAGTANRIIGSETHSFISLHSGASDAAIVSLSLAVCGNFSILLFSSPCSNVVGGWGEKSVLGAEVKVTQKKW